MLQLQRRAWAAQGQHRATGQGDQLPERNHVSAGLDPSGRLPAVFTTPGLSSFSDFLTAAAPQLLPGRRPLPPGLSADIAPHGTTIVAISCADGVVMAGDRRATMGNLIASRDIEKVYAADRLATMIRNNLGAALQGLAVIPLFAGFDLDAADPTKAGRIFSFDVAGGLYEETSYDAIGSGSLFAKSSLKKRHQRGISLDEAVRLSVEALYDAADDDTATGGPDPIRKIYPVVMTATAEGSRKLPEEEITPVAEAVIAGRAQNPGG